jgi:hypothetical protein
MCRKQVKLFKTILLVMMIALFISDGAWGIVGDVWNAKDDWSDISNPNVRTSPPYGTWSYRVNVGLRLKKRGLFACKPALSAS